MKLIAHRGWSAGGDENTLVAFARADRISGVEFDVCRSLVCIASLTFMAILLG
jgi:glycerophosphoryl diester phosphodiesterase